MMAIMTETMTTMIHRSLKARQLQLQPRRLQPLVHLQQAQLQDVACHQCMKELFYTLMVK